MKYFHVRVTSPTADNEYYKRPTNPCIRINGNSCLPNCVGYVYGAWQEMFGSHRLPTTDAKTFYTHRVDGYSRSQTPKIGAIACWNGRMSGVNSHGHVAIVVGVQDDHITVAQSNYGGTYFEIVSCDKNSKGGYTSHNGNTRFQGFILPPDGYMYAGNATHKDNATIANEVLAGKWGNGEERKQRLTNAGYDYTVIQSIVNELCNGKKSVDDVAYEVIRGEWGNGAERKQRLTQAGYDYATIQRRVEEILK